MKNIYFTTKLVSTYIGLGFIFLASLSSCKKSPIDNVRIVIDPDVIKYSMLLEIRDAADNKIKPQDVTVSFSGQDAGHIYEAAGKKKFTVQEGVINIGLGPDRKPVTGSPAKFTVVVNANGYLPVTRDLEISDDKNSQVVSIKLININKPPAGLEIIQQSVSLANGSVAQRAAYGISSKAPSVNRKLSGDKLSATSTASATTPIDDQTQVVLPEGTKFYYYQAENTGTVTSTIRVPVSKTENVELNEGNGTATYTRIVDYVTKEIVEPATTYRKVNLSKENVIITAVYRKGEDIPYSVYPYDIYKSFDAKLLTGQTLAEDKILYKSAVTKKLVDLFFTAKVEDKTGTTTTIREVVVTPENPISWYTSFVLNPSFINPVTNKAIVNGDVIECGLDPKNKTTLRTTVKEVILGNGSKQLRAESQTTDIGYYFPAVYTADYNYSFNTALSAEIADVYNVYGYIYIGINTGSANLGTQYKISPDRGAAALSGKIRSFTPIQISSGYTVSYWGKSYSSIPISGGSGTFNVFADIAQKLTIEPAVSLDLKFTCPGKVEYLGFGTAYITGSDEKEGWAHLKNGKWATNGFTQGQSYHAEINIDGGLITWDNKIEKYNYVEKKSLKTCPDK
ncbi:hypothetical protein [Pedobacter psychroterrae]|uniref:Uncharacterized protein n=1 Tax=Pedobacter psychroterrae TaxID=2530453 RepID=A0A4R0NEW6_9SPHI|nr:hypothetical protein [Pedobacter psychroterrae]TCC98991.1 hypothetical protein EZ437_17810 [Pedobacter psychroterrae]